ncbi:MAG: mechanosensitive ion channel family protein [Aestuariibacter sp.]
MLELQEMLTLITDKLRGWLEASIVHVPNLVVALLIVLAFSFLARIASRIIKPGLYRLFHTTQIADLLTSIFRMTIMIIGVFIALDFIGLSGTVKSLLAGAGIVGLAISLAFQDTTENFIAGIAMGIRKPFQIGHVVKTGDVFGEVKAINLRNTLVETFYGQLEIVPNKLMFRNVLTNYSEVGSRLIEIPVGISYADDITKAETAIVSAINQHNFVIKPDETAVYAEGFGDSSINLLVWFWIDYPGETGFLDARHKAIMAIKNALDEADILIPFPIRTLDFDTKGGTSLQRAMSEKVDVN